MALYTVQSCIDFTKILIEEASETNVVTENQLITMVSLAQKWVAVEAGCYQSWQDITLTADESKYTAPTGTSGVLGLTYDYGDQRGERSLQQVEPGSIPHPPDELLPYFWFFNGAEIVVLPKLPEVPSNATVHVLVNKLPASLTALTESLVIPDEFQIVVPYRVAETVAIKDNQMAKQQQLNQKVIELTRRGVAQYSTSSAIGGMGGPAAPAG